MMTSILLSILIASLPVSGDVIPDFSYVGYKNGDEPLPDYPVVETISVKDIAKALKRRQCADTTSFIQAAIDRVAGKGGATVLLKDGVYNVGRVLFIEGNDVVLRGESREGTILRSTGKIQRPAVVIGNCIPYKESDDPKKYGNFDGRRFGLSKIAVVDGTGRSNYGKYFLRQWLPATKLLTVKERTRIMEDYCPVGRMWVEVENPELFSVGDPVIIERPHSEEWLSDIGMDKIASNGRSTRPVIQWTRGKMRFRWTRKVTAVEGNKVWLDGPLVQSIDANYGGGYVCKYVMKRVSGSGIENLTISSSYDPSIKYKDGTTCCDENHTWYGVVFLSAEDCFARRVDVRHVGFAAVMLISGTRCVTVEDCSFREPVSIPLSARRYGFCINGAEMCLLSHCYAELAAIGFSTNASGGGPNVFHKCRGENMRTGAGPHRKWSTGTLYDCCYNSAGFRCTDHGNSGTGHGWCGANTVFWNVETDGIIQCESPWAAENTPELKFYSPYPSGRNYAVGVVGGKRVKVNLLKDFYGTPVVDYYDSLGFHSRPDAKWYPKVDYGGSGTRHISLPCPEAEAEFDWWPKLKAVSFTDPLSLYQCQLESRKAK